MRHRFSISILASGVLLLAPMVPAQYMADTGPGSGAPVDHTAGRCGALGLRALLGTYALTGTAWQDLSQIDPLLPGGYAPVSIIGVFTVTVGGEVTGWALVNAGGLQMTAEFVDSWFDAPRADCSVPISLSMRIDEFGGAVAGPYSYVGVVAGHGPTLEIDFMMLGTGPGSHLELNHAKRISARTCVQLVDQDR